MALGTPTVLGTVSTNNAVAAVALTTTATINAGDLVYILAWCPSSATINSATDGSLNTYTTLTNRASTAANMRALYCPNAAALASGGLITVTFGVGSILRKFVAVSISGADLITPSDKTTGGNSGTSTAPSGGTGTLAQAKEICFSNLGIESGGGDTFTEDTTHNWISLTSELTTSALRLSYQIINSTAGATYTPILGTSRAWGANANTFKEAAAPSVSAGGTLAMMGI